MTAQLLSRFWLPLVLFGLIGAVAFCRTKGRIERQNPVYDKLKAIALTILGSLPLTVVLATETPTNPAAPEAQSRKSGAEQAARQLIKTLGAQQTFAMLGWQQNPDYKPARHCFLYWQDANTLNAQQTMDCEHHVNDLSRLYASYGVDAPSIAFKSTYYWDQKARFDQLWPELVEDWKSAGGRKEDASYLQHPGCAKPLQKGWTGSEYFYDGTENPICRTHKIEQMQEHQKR